MSEAKNKNINTLSDLRIDLISVYNDLRNGSISLGEAKEIANMAGKIISTLKVEIAYEIHKGHINTIDFIETKLLDNNSKAVVHNIPTSKAQ